MKVFAPDGVLHSKREKKALLATGNVRPKPRENHQFGQNKVAMAVKDQKITACTEKLTKTV